MKCKPELGVKQLIGTLTALDGQKWHVLVTGSPKHLMFSALDKTGQFAVGYQKPILISDLGEVIKLRISYMQGKCPDQKRFIQYLKTAAKKDGISFNKALNNE